MLPPHKSSKSTSFPRVANTIFKLGSNSFIVSIHILKKSLHLLPKAPQPQQPNIKVFTLLSSATLMIYFIFLRISSSVASPTLGAAHVITSHCLVNPVVLKQPSSLRYVTFLVYIWFYRMLYLTFYYMYKTYPCTRQLLNSHIS